MSGGLRLRPLGREDYEGVSRTEEEDDLRASVWEAQEPPQPHCCAKCCTLMGISGVVFLLTIHAYLAADSPYLMLSSDAPPKTDVAGTVVGAIVMWAVVAIVSAGFWIRAVSKGRGGSKGNSALAQPLLSAEGGGSGKSWDRRGSVGDDPISGGNYYEMRQSVSVSS